MMSSTGRGTGAGAPPQMDLSVVERQMIMKAKEMHPRLCQKKKKKINDFELATLAFSHASHFRG